MVWGAISLISQSHLVFLQDKVNSAHYIAQIVNPVLLPFLRQEGDVLLPHMAVAMQHALRDVQQLSWPARNPDLSPIEHVWNMMKWELTLSPECATTNAKLRHWVQDAWDNLSQDDIRHLYDHNTRLRCCCQKVLHVY